MSEASNNFFDVVIVGGGLAGASMALALAPALAKSKRRIAVIEAHPYQQQRLQPSFDDRCLALAWSSKQIYQSMGIWDELAKHCHEGQSDGFAAIKQIHISERGHLGVTRLDQQKEAVPALGSVVESRVLGEVLVEQMKLHDNIHVFCPASIEQLATNADEVSISLIVDPETELEPEPESAQAQSKHQKIKASLLIVADGVNSQTRESLGIKVNQKAYAQTAIIANIETAMPHNNIAYERFTDSGPLAVLPLTRNRSSLVWTVKDEQLDDVMAMNDAEFSQALQQRFGHRLGQIKKVGHRAAYPLMLMTIDNETLAYQQRVALIGNAAHGVHPVAGQGFNLGLRDISALAELIVAEVQAHKSADLGNDELLSRYWQWRQADIKQVTRITNGLIKLFSNHSTSLAILRNSGLFLTDIISPLKHVIAHEAMGNGILQGRMSKMAVGQSLL
ncbi:2-octaprenyl-6-methoxyphenyl hydroxylase [sulfur-oxidizing endosymbiont of Gigantopelta aegis]|uniref:2-octaprenyl-6-methoxyphenyl hydroxylase n=1 Tax=sulfur-oxidizing endosymbiont of Gigantopelta aegis TaxID=2794934 RepID=UPI0018DB9B3F|nr:2-octaprenyl-6-methoxyphenyl hydroxylase [sulfur-oxidizing endosymbiont of Gigantopelta aegis]